MRNWGRFGNRNRCNTMHMRRVCWRGRADQRFRGRNIQESSCPIPGFRELSKVACMVATSQPLWGPWSVSMPQIQPTRLQPTKFDQPLYRRDCHVRGPSTPWALAPH